MLELKPFSNYIIKGVRGLRAMGGWLSPQNVLEKWFCLCHLILKIFALSLSHTHTETYTHNVRELKLWSLNFKAWDIFVRTAVASSSFHILHGKIRGSLNAEYRMTLRSS